MQDGTGSDNEETDNIEKRYVLVTIIQVAIFLTWLHLYICLHSIIFPNRYVAVSYGTQVLPAEVSIFC